MTLFSFQQGAIDATVPEASIKVLDPDSPKPSIIMSVVDQAGPASQLVSEMMIACGEALAAFGEEKNISLPYRGQASQEIPAGDMEAIPEGPCRALALRRYLGRADMSFMKPISHAALGVRGYVQFTSPIRRYSDLLAHYQVSHVSAKLIDLRPLSALIGLRSFASKTKLKSLVSSHENFIWLKTGYLCGLSKYSLHLRTSMKLVEAVGKSF